MQSDKKELMSTDEEIQKYVDTIDRVGFVEVSNLYSNDLLSHVEKLIEPPLNTPMINGQMGYVQSGAARFLMATLSYGVEIIDLYTHPTVLKIAEAYTGDENHLSNYRIYRSFPSRVTKMDWHVDNKIDYVENTLSGNGKNFVTKMKPGNKGVILIAYLSDVKEGGVQIVKGSHKWTSKVGKEIFNDCEKKFSNDIVTFNHRPRGTALIYDYRCIHRAQPYRGAGSRTSLFAQYSTPDMPSGEPIFLNARDLNSLSDLQKRVLNFGQKPSSINWPVGSVHEIFQIQEYLKLGKNLVKSRVKNVLKGCGLI